MTDFEHKILTDCLELHFLSEAMELGDLTHDEVRDMLTLVRRIKINLEILDAQKENDI